MTKKEYRMSQILSLLETSKALWISEIQEWLIKQWIVVDNRSIQRDIWILIERNLIKKEGSNKDITYSISDNYEILKGVDSDAYFATDYTLRFIKETFDFWIFDLLWNIELFTEEEKKHLNTLHSKFLYNISKYDSQTLINKEYERIMIELSWKSSSIEWNTYSILSTESLIKDHIFDDTKTKEEAQMILNHKDCFNEMILNKEHFLKINIADIEYLHSILIKHLWVEKNIRKIWVGVSWTKYVPLDNAHQIRDALEKMVELINKKDFFFEKALLAILLISYIQPFEDGNKRTSRMLSNAILLANNSIPLSYRAVSVDDYKKAIVLFYEINNVSLFKEIFIKQVENAVSVFFVWASHQIINK